MESPTRFGRSSDSTSPVSVSTVRSVWQHGQVTSAFSFIVVRVGLVLRHAVCGVNRRGNCEPHRVGGASPSRSVDRQGSLGHSRIVNILLEVTMSHSRNPIRTATIAFLAGSLILGFVVPALLQRGATAASGA